MTETTPSIIKPQVSVSPRKRRRGSAALFSSFFVFSLPPPLRQGSLFFRCAAASPRQRTVYAAMRMRMDMRRLSTPLTACWMSFAATPSSTSVDRGGSLICFEGDPFLEKNLDPFFS